MNPPVIPMLSAVREVTAEESLKCELAAEKASNTQREIDIWHAISRHADAWTVHELLLKKVVRTQYIIMAGVSITSILEIIHILLR